MYGLLLWIFFVSLVKYSQQTCSSTVAITTCTWDTVRPNKPLQINDYRTYLSFSRGNLEQVPSGSFRFLPQVTVLQLSYNKIKNLDADAFLGLHDLKELKLYDNQLNAIGEDTFKHCPNVQTIDLGLNKIASIHDRTFEHLHSLKFLNLGFNSLKSLPIAVNSLPQLETLKLDNNALGNLKANQLSNLNKLHELFLSDNKITTIERHSFKGLVNLKQLDLKSNYLTDLNVEDLLNDAGALKLVSLSINDFKCNLLTQIVDKFKKINVEVARGVSRSANNVNGISCKR